MIEIMTGRLKLIPCSTEAAQAALAGPAPLEAQLGVHVSADWPAPDLRDFLVVYPKLVDAEAMLRGWGVWLILLPAERSLIGDVGFKGPPDEHGVVEIGYSVLPAYQRCGYAGEAARALIEWAFVQQGVRRVVAECLEDNAASIRVLEKLGMRRIGQDGDMLKWQITGES
jgi:ribosomal-protein-alanine N-acetyltransferase